MTLVGMVWAQGPGRVIAVDGEIPWHVPEDFAHFRSTVAGHAVIMGRVTWDSMPPALQPIPKVTRSVVVTHDGEWNAPGAERASSVEQALELLAGEDEVWVMGGAQVYALGIAHADRLVVSEIDAELPDLTDRETALAPPVGGEWEDVTPDGVAGERVSSEGIGWQVRVYERT